MLGPGSSASQSQLIGIVFSACSCYISLSDTGCTGSRPHPVSLLRYYNHFRSDVFRGDDLYIGAGTFSVLFPKRHYPWGVSREDRDWDLVITGSFKPMVFPVEKRVLM